MRVKECMCKKIVKTTKETLLSDVAKLMYQNDIGCVPVCNEENNVIGFVTDRDIITRCVAQNKECNNTKVSDIMTNNVIKTTPDAEVNDAIIVMSKNQIKRLPVIENNQIIGILTLGDLAQNDDVSSKDIGCTVECICGCQNYR